MDALSAEEQATRDLLLAMKACQEALGQVERRVSALARTVWMDEPDANRMFGRLDKISAAHLELLNEVAQVAGHHQLVLLMRPELDAASVVDGPRDIREKRDQQ